MAKKGAKLEKLTSFKKATKCKCGCAMVDVKEKGGKISSTCSCKCGGKVKTPKKEKGGTLIQKYATGETISKNAGFNPLGKVVDKRLLTTKTTPVANYMSIG